MSKIIMTDHGYENKIIPLPAICIEKMSTVERCFLAQFIELTTVTTGHYKNETYYEDIVNAVVRLAIDHMNLVADHKFVVRRELKLDTLKNESEITNPGGLKIRGRIEFVVCVEYEGNCVIALVVEVKSPDTFDKATSDQTAAELYKCRTKNREFIYSNNSQFIENLYHECYPPTITSTSTTTTAATSTSMTTTITATTKIKMKKSLKKFTKEYIELHPIITHPIGILTCVEKSQMIFLGLEPQREINHTEKLDTTTAQLFSWVCYALNNFVNDIYGTLPSEDDNEEDTVNSDDK